MDAFHAANDALFAEPPYTDLHERWCAHHSDEIMNSFLRMAGRPDLIVAVKLAVTEDAIADLLLAVRSMNGSRT